MNKTRLITALGISTAAALVLSYVETLIPVPFAVPGVKLGLANVTALFLLIKLDWKYAGAVSLVRVLLSSILFGSFMSLAYSASGALLSITVMSLLKRTEKFSPVGISVSGAVSHNAGQILMAVILLSTKEIIYWLPVLLVTGTVSGLAIGALGSLLAAKIDLKIDH